VLADFDRGGDPLHDHQLAIEQLVRIIGQRT
jgi:hypothetical protein